MLPTFSFSFSDNEWILLNKEVKCDDNDDNSPATLGLSNMRGVFIMVVFGIVGGMFLICLEIMFKKHQKRMQKKDSMAKTAVRKWRGNVEVPTYRNFVKISFLSFKLGFTNFFLIMANFDFLFDYRNAKH